MDKQQQQLEFVLGEEIGIRLCGILGIPEDVQEINIQLKAGHLVVIRTRSLLHSDKADGFVTSFCGYKLVKEVKDMKKAYRIHTPDGESRIVQFITQVDAAPAGSRIEVVDVEQLTQEELQQLNPLPKSGRHFSGESTFVENK